MAFHKGMSGSSYREPRLRKSITRGIVLIALEQYHFQELQLSKQP
jgi:hypothetical protein